MQDREKFFSSSLLVGNTSHSWPFSRGLVVKSLIHAGADRQEASSVARYVEQHLRLKKISPVHPNELHQILIEITKTKIGEELAHKVATQTPFFKDIQIISKTSKMPFSRSILAVKLEDTGLRSKIAYAAARKIDLNLRSEGIQELTAKELINKVEKYLLENHGKYTAAAYKFVISKQNSLGVVGTNGEIAIPFSKGILIQSLLIAGASPETARIVASSVHRQLRKHQKVTSRREIREITLEHIRNLAGKHISARYSLLHEVRKLPKPLFILVGGVSGTGKSRLASEVAYRLGISRIANTDSIREVLRATVAKELAPTLHTSTFTAWKYILEPEEEIPEHPGDNLLYTGFREQIRQVSVGLNSVFNRVLVEDTNLVAEGVHLLPAFLDSKIRQKAIVIQVLLTINDEEEHKNRFHKRNEETDCLRSEDKYLKHFYEIRRLQDYLIKIAKTNSIPILSELDFNHQVEKTIDVVLAKIPSILREMGTLAIEDEEEISFLEFTAKS